MSRFFIERPIFASVIAIIIVIAGLVAAKMLPIAQYPEIAPPTVTITTTYTGASAETLAKSVAAPIEEQLSGVERLLYFSSTSASRASRVTASTSGALASYATHWSVAGRGDTPTLPLLGRMWECRLDTVVESAATIASQWKTGMGLP